MSKPPMKAVEQIRRWCEKHFCDKCPFADAEIDSEDYLIFKCSLNELLPYQWDGFCCAKRMKKIDL